VRVICLDELVARETAPGGHVFDGAGIARDETQPLSGLERLEAKAKLEEQFAAAHGSGVPGCVGGQVSGAARRRGEASHSLLLGMGNRMNADLNKAAVEPSRTSIAARNSCAA